MAADPRDVAAEQFSAFVTRSPKEVILHLCGELDMASAPALAVGLERLGAPDGTLVVLDASRLDFCDSSGLGVLVGYREQARRRGVRITLRAASPALRRVLELTRLDDLLETDSRGGQRDGDA